jgi:LacI family transcriptional regulator
MKTLPTRGRGKRSGRPTLVDVAREAGVSAMTASNFVRGKSVSPKTRLKLEGAISRLNYRPNASARSLRLSTEYSVGMLIADTDPAYLNDPFISRLVSGLSNYLSSLDYTLDIQGVAPERFAGATILTKVGNAALCAILCGPRALRREYLKTLQRLGQPVVVFQEAAQSAGPNMAIISQNDLSAGKLMGRHLLQKKRVRSILFVRPALDWYAIEQREKGLRSIFERAERPVEVATVVSDSERFDDVQKVVAQHLARRRPDAIVAATDSMAVAALASCESAAIQVPSDVIVAGFNGFDVWRYTTPTLTTILSPAYELGMYAGQLLIERLRTGKFPTHRAILPIQLQVGGSTAD